MASAVSEPPLGYHSSVIEILTRRRNPALGPC